MSEQEQIENEIKNILETLRFHMSLEKYHFTYMDLMIRHNPKTVDEYKYMRNCISRELEYRKTQATWREARSISGGSFLWSHYEKNKVLEIYRNSSGALTYEPIDNELESEIDTEN